MKVRFPLYLQTFGMLILYLATLLIITFVCFNAQFGIGWEAALASPLGERFETIAGVISSQLHASYPKNWSQILNTFADSYHVNFYVFDIAGNEVAGDKITLPATVCSKIGPLPPLHAGAEGEFPWPPPRIGPDGPPLGSGPDGPEPHGIGPDHRHAPPEDFAPGKTHAFPFHGEPPAVFFSQAHGRFLVHTKDPDLYWICAHIHVDSPALGHPVPGLLVATCRSLWQSSLLFDFKFFSSLFAVVLIFSLLFWWPFIFRITHALARLTQATELIAQGKFDTRIKAKGADEIGRLSESIDTLAERLEGYVQEQKRLLADISHELFSPIARLQLALELLEDGSKEQQQEHIEDIREEVREMNNLVSELIQYSKAGMQAKTPEQLAVNLRKTIESLIPRVASNRHVVIEVPADMEVIADRLLLERAISNVLRNAVRYAGEKGQIKVMAVQDAAQIVLTICDNGPGVSQEALKHLGQPFYRPEASRNRASGGFGLGLAIVKSCIEACQGTVSLSNSTPTGLQVEIRLNAAPALT